MTAASLSNKLTNLRINWLTSDDSSDLEFPTVKLTPTKEVRIIHGRPQDSEKEYFQLVEVVDGRTYFTHHLSVKDLVRKLTVV